MHPKKHLAFLFAFIIFVVACGGPAERIRETAAITPTPPPAPTEREISGTFNVSGARDNGSEPYTGLLTIAPQGDVYGFRWSTTKGSRVGVGVQIGTATAAGFAAPGSGAGCGVLLFKVDTVGGVLEGSEARLGKQDYLRWIAKRIEGTTFAGKYRYTSRANSGAEYSGDLKITKDGDGFDLEWTQDENGNTNASMIAFGARNGSYAAASFGGRQCSFALYDIQSNGNLEGNWGGQKAVTFGTETAKRQ